MAYAYDSEITPWLSALPSGPFTDVRALRTPTTARTYAPAERDGLLSGLLHDPGIVMDSLDQFDATATRIAAEAGTVVASAEYRLTPEHPCPGIPHGGLIPESTAGRRLLADTLAALRPGLGV
ncbi:alpha/beta hydrolase fold domain-containing protein [Streptomyces sp. NPDC050528]|uniref:alpha/beta hydrolase fold domain-containing protein n=1 Tax=Streptomyces sp. NPDC050528 TaxID=3365623 RepID=UPI0037A5EEEE